MAGLTVEVRLQDDLRRQRIDLRLGVLCASRTPRAAVAAAAGFAQAFLGLDRGVTLVDVRDGQAETAAQLVGETRAARGHGVRAAVGRQRQTDDEGQRPPLVDERRDGGEAFAVGLADDRRQRMRLAQLPLADGDADTLFSEIESLDRAAPRHVVIKHARPAR